MGEEPREVTQMLNFLVIKASSTYNAILGRTGLHIFKVISSTYHLKIKFPARNGVREQKGDQKVVRSCYVSSWRTYGKGGQILPLDEMDLRKYEEHQGKPVEDLVEVPYLRTRLGK